MIKIALIYAQDKFNASLSYQHGWPNALKASPLFNTTPINLLGISFTQQFNLIRQLHAGNFDAVVMLHSVFSNQNNMVNGLYLALSTFQIPKVYFIGNEYKLMPEKIKFCKRLKIDLLITQSNDARVMKLYEDAIGCDVASMPNTGINPKIFFPRNQGRQIDIGYRAFIAPLYLGNDEKAEIANYFALNSKRFNIRVDISLNPESRFDANGYANFLNKCRGQIGTEAGGDYFELNDFTRNRVNDYLNKNPNATWKTVKSLFFDNYGQSVPIRIISGRQVEAAACKTIQILFKGSYGGFLQPDEHYIMLEKDFSNIDEVMMKFNDLDYCLRITTNAYDVIMNEFTYETLVKKFHALISAVI